MESPGGFIWVSPPFVERAKGVNAITWWGDVDATIEYCLGAVSVVCKKWAVTGTGCSSPASPAARSLATIPVYTMTPSPGFGGVLSPTATTMACAPGPIPAAIARALWSVWLASTTPPVHLA